jgi:hypothetical protein
MKEEVETAQVAKEAERKARRSHENGATLAKEADKSQRRVYKK